MKFRKVMFLLIVVVIAATGCGNPSDEKAYYKAHKKMMEIKSYEATVKISSYTGDSTREYKFSQMFQYPDKYRLEVISPSDFKGNVTVYNGKVAWIKHPAINQVWKMDNFEQSNEQLMFVGHFLKNFVNSENSNYHKEKINGQNSIVITTEVPGGNPHFYKQRLWVRIGDYTPIQLSVMDEQEKSKFEVYFEDFKINPKLDEKLFYLD
ncbi:MAG: LolA family protein [Candidatus Alkaliphilus sp. MAG34]|nr:outer membrane lipoprotein carrier protein LolA [Clostridiales bacterium]